MPRYFITRNRALSSFEVIAPDGIDAIREARLVLIAEAKTASVTVSLIPETPYDEADGRSEALTLESDPDAQAEAETEARMGLRGDESAGEELKPWAS